MSFTFKAAATTPSTGELTPLQIKRYRHLLGGDDDLFDRFLEAKRTGGSLLDVLTSESVPKNKQSSTAIKSSTSLKHLSKPSPSSKRKGEGEGEGEGDEGEGDEVIVKFQESPSYIKGGEMRPYQIQGLNWLISLNSNNINGILADEMGLGKTLQTLSLLGYLLNFRSNPGPHLLIVPKSTLHNWKREIERWVPSLTGLLFHGDKDERAQLIKDNLKVESLTFNILITSYEMCLLEKSALKAINWCYLIMDEAHRIKNEDSKLSIIVRTFNSQNRLLITGTPLQNNLHELWALLNFLMPDLFASSDDFDLWFKERSGVSSLSSADDSDVRKNSMIKSLKNLLQPFLLRRLKADVEHTLLPKKEVNLYITMTPMQKEWYRRILERDVFSILSSDPNKKDCKVRLLNVVMQLRKCCNHPYLFEGAEPGPPYTTGEHLIEASGKMKVLDSLLGMLKARGSRVLIFSQMTRMLDIVEDYCVTLRNWGVCRIDGSTPHQDRRESIDEFNGKGCEKFIFLLTTRAGGLGINLASADTVILLDSDWNPQVDLQAQDRVHRIGQTKQVHIFRFVIENSVEEKIIEKATAKLRLDQLVIQQGKLTNLNKPLTPEEMLSMIKYGASDLLNDGDSSNNKNSFDIETLLRKGEARTKELMEKYEKIGYENLHNFAVDGLASITTTTTASELKDDDAINEIASAATAASIAIDAPLGPRERKRVMDSLEIDGYFREALSVGGGAGSSNKTPMPKGIINLAEFQFWPKRLHELQEIEISSHQRKVGYLKDDGNKEDEWNDSLQKEKDILVEKCNEVLSSPSHQGIDAIFPFISRREYQAFLRGIERYGKKAFSSIILEIKESCPYSSLNVKELRRYSKVFWARIEELSDGDKILNMVERAYARLIRQREGQNAIDLKVFSSNSRLRIPYYSGGRGKQWTEDEDVYLLKKIAFYGNSSNSDLPGSEIGWGPGREERIARRIRKDLSMSSSSSSSSSDYTIRFDLFLRTRTIPDIQRRCSKLVTLIEREQKEKIGGGDDDFDNQSDGVDSESDDQININQDGDNPSKKKKKNN